MGHIDNDKLLTILLFNVLGNNFSCLQTSINDMFMNSSTMSADVRNHLLLEEQVILDNAATSPTTALAAVSAKPACPVCANCKRPTHCMEFCVVAGGQMAGKMIEEAHTAQDAACNAQKPGGANRTCGNRPTVPTPTQNDGTNAKTLTVNGQCYMLIMPTATPPPPVLLILAMPLPLSPCRHTMRRSIWQYLPPLTMPMPPSTGTHSPTPIMTLWTT